ncbi:GNAT family N-acetyltransferase [Winogradskyella sp.]|uniref:GNAT family N-acetyltransferase n=1 Tax=Winogradskyella sp. TaxID=1883156 RepID=UPI003BAD62E9
MGQLQNISIEYRKLTLNEYQFLRGQTNWISLDDMSIAKAINNDIFTVIAKKEKDIVGMGRVIGDGGIYLYIQDIIVHKDHRNLGIGKRIMGCINHFIETEVSPNCSIGLFAAKGTIKFYKKFGFKIRAYDSPGMIKYN